MHPQDFPPVPQHDIIATLDFRRKAYIISEAIPRGAGPAIKCCYNEIRNGIIYASKLLVTIHPQWVSTQIEVPLQSENPVLLGKSPVDVRDRNSILLLYRAIEETLDAFIAVLEQSAALCHAVYFQPAMEAVARITDAQLHLQTALSTPVKYPQYAEKGLSFC